MKLNVPNLPMDGPTLPVSSSGLFETGSCCRTELEVIPRAPERWDHRRATCPVRDSDNYKYLT